jgi:hypothetical protein
LDALGAVPVSDSTATLDLSGKPGGPKLNIEYPGLLGAAPDKVSIPLPTPRTLRAYQHGMYVVGGQVFFYDLKFPKGDGPKPTLEISLRLTGSDEARERWFLVPDVSAGEAADTWEVLEH